MSQNSLLAKDHFLLGTFASNCSGGMTVSKLPERWDATWASNLKLAQMLDDAGIDFMLPIARWVGYRGNRLPWLRARDRDLGYSSLAHTKTLMCLPRCTP